MTTKTGKVAPGLFGEYWTPEADAWIRRRREFVRAAVALSEAWEDLSLEDARTASIGYPSTLPSFDEFTRCLIDWRDTTDLAAAVSGARASGTI